MFAVRRIFRNRKTLSNCISTSNVVECQESKKSKEASSSPQEKDDLTSKKTARSEKDIYRNIFSGSTNEEEINKPVPKKKSKHFRWPQKGQKPKNDSKPIFKTDIFKKMLVSSAENVAKDLGGNKTETKKDLLDYIKTFEVTKEPAFTESEYVKPLEDVSFSKSLFEDAKGLNIFHPKIMEATEDQVKLNIWDTLEKEDLEYRSLLAPRNHFEELIQWTNEGKLWKFPIDNDQGLEEEAKVSFTEHVFLEQHLEPWCPKRGPIRKFMELVLIGLSKNPYLTVDEKKEHIAWFENYFENKKKLLQELGAVGTTKEIDV